MRWMGLAWAVFFAPFVWNHLRVRRERHKDGSVERRVDRAPVSNQGLLLQFASIGLAFAAGGELRLWLLPWALAMSAGATLLSGWALVHLGRQWRIQAVVAEDHRLVTSGPYSIVRHPVYLALLLMLVATLLVRSNWWSALVSLAGYLGGTEIRVRAEEGLLRARFRSEFEAFAARTFAYLPGLR
ncbi:MAG: isoprenylcysteine carboxylmethyltransferase family protein [Bryobacterales bacterium]|nr:isoprenylcysteine carboxylmethyltransferase family protein [Bryobacterales bacterium]